MLLVNGGTKAVRKWHARRPDRVGVLLRPGAGIVRDMVASMATGADNGCFGGLDAPSWLRFLAELVTLPRLSFVTAPDVLGDATETLKRFRVWGPMIRELGQPVALVGQDGLRADAVPWSEIDAYFIGGSTEWKLSGESRMLAAHAKDRGKHVHMGRVNTLERFLVAAKWGCDSADGSSFSKWSDTLIPKAVRWIDRAMGGPLFAVMENSPRV